MEGRHTDWSVTINNPTSEDEECINLARQKGWKVEGQLEKGNEGTTHYQLMVHTPQQRFSALKKAFPRAHIEAARNVSALKTYVNKEETRVGQLSEQSDKYPSLSKYWDLIYSILSDKFFVEIPRITAPTSFTVLQHVFILDNEMPTSSFMYLRDNPLYMLDEATRILITQGYHVESIAANPSTRSMWKLYYHSIMYRSFINIKNNVVIKQNAHEDSSIQKTNIPTIEIDSTKSSENDSEVEKSESN